jgi:hypothetical protein
MRGMRCSFLRWAMLASFVAGGLPGWTQESGKAAAPASEDSLSESVRELRQQVHELQDAVAEIRSEAQQYRAETMQLRRELEVLHGSSDMRAVEAAGVNQPASATATVAGATQADQSSQTQKQARAASLEEEYQLLAGKIDDQYQTKVESASKYRVRLSGIVLLNLFSNVGTVENIDFPSLAYDNPRGSSGGSFGGTLRQSQVGLEVFGPQLAGARTRADLQLDLSGGFAQTLNGVNSGFLRLRTGTMRLDWKNTSVVAGQDNIFFSPGSPTSFASLAIPALSYSGNLWGWIPQLRVEHRVPLGEDSNLVLQGGILDPLSGEPPVFSFYRQPQAGEFSREPAYGSRIGWTRTLFGQPLRLGMGGYYSRQDYRFNRMVDGWAGMADMDMPLGSRLSLSGKVYRGRGLGGLGGGIGRSVLFNGDLGQPTTIVRAINSVGGWTQLKYRATSTLEFNAAVGLDNPFSADIHAFAPNAQAFGDPTLIKNQGGFFNVIYRPRSDLLFSGEYHRLKTFQVNNGGYGASHIDLTMGVLF